MKHIFLYTLLLTSNIYFMLSNIELKINNDISSKKNKILSNQFESYFIDSIKVIDKDLLENELNLVILWTENGCSSCKQALADKFLLYKQNYFQHFKFIYIGDERRDCAIYRVNQYLSKVYKSSEEIFSGEVKLTQPIIFLTDKDGLILLKYEMMSNKKKFDSFNNRICSVFNLCKL